MFQYMIFEGMYLYVLHKSRNKMLTSIQVQPASHSPHPASASAATFIPVTWNAIGHNLSTLGWQREAFFAYGWDPQEQWKSDLKKAGERWRQMGNLAHFEAS